MVKHWPLQLADLVLVAAMLSCGAAEPGPAADTAMPSEDGRAPGEPGTAIVVPSGTIDSDTRVVLDRWGCYGLCPFYSLSIAGDGSVTYVGRQYVNVKGEASARLPVSDVQALVDQMLQADYFELSVPEECPQPMPFDLSGAMTSLTLQGQTHTVEHYHGNPCAPGALFALEDAIDAVVDSSAWLRCDTPCGGCWDPTGNPYLLPCGK